MIKKDITYKDLDGNEVTEEFYFSLSMAEVVEQDMAVRLMEIQSTKDNFVIMKHFTEILRAAVGTRSSNSRRLSKDSSMADDFITSPAFDALLWELLGNEAYAAEFVVKIFPEGMTERIMGLTAQLPAEPKKRLEDYSEEELLNMSAEEWRRVAGTDPKKWLGSPAILQVAMKRRIAGKE